jgi:hypothetical protein
VTQHQLNWDSADERDRQMIVLQAVVKYFVHHQGDDFTITREELSAVAAEGWLQVEQTPEAVRLWIE